MAAQGRMNSYLVANFVWPEAFCADESEAGSLPAYVYDFVMCGITKAGHIVLFKRPYGRFY